MRDGGWGKDKNNNSDSIANGHRCLVSAGNSEGGQIDDNKTIAYILTTENAEVAHKKVR